MKTGERCPCGNHPTLLQRLAFWRARRKPKVIGVIWRWDLADELTDIEAEHWELNLLPFGWSIISDSRKSRS